MNVFTRAYLEGLHLGIQKSASPDSWGDAWDKHIGGNWNPFRYEDENPSLGTRAALASSALVGKGLSLIPGARRLIGEVASRTIPKFNVPYGYGDPLNIQYPEQRMSLSQRMKLEGGKPLSSNELDPGNIEARARSVLIRNSLDMPNDPQELRNIGLQQTGAHRFRFDTSTRAGSEFATNKDSLRDSLLGAHDFKTMANGGRYHDLWDLALNKRPNSNTREGSGSKILRAFAGGVMAAPTINGIYSNSSVAKTKAEIGPLPKKTIPAAMSPGRRPFGGFSIYEDDPPDPPPDLPVDFPLGVTPTH